MHKMKMLPAVILALAASAAVPGAALADEDGYRSYGPGYGDYAPREWAYSDVPIAYPYFGREHRRAQARAEREYRRHLKREVKAYRKLMRAYDRYQFEFDYYYYEPSSVPYRPADEELRYPRRLGRGDD
jgi:hypothetical protein